MKKLLSLILFSLVSWANLPNPNLLPLGDKEMFMSNTGVAGTTSPGAIYYNPGALTEVPDSFSVSGSTYARFNFEIDPLFNFDGENLHYKATGFSAIPSTLISVFKRGKWSFAYSILTPHQFIFENKVTYSTSGALKTDFTIIQNFATEDLYFGLTASRKIGREQSLGLTIFGIKHSELEVFSSNAVFKFVNNATVTTNSRKQLDAYMVIGVFGYQYKYKKHKFGIRLQTPSYKVRTRGDYFSQKIEVETGIVSTTTTDEKNMKPDYKLPWDLSFGHSFLATNSLRINVDIAYQFKEEFTKFPIADLTENHVKYDGSARYKIGIEKYINKTLRLLAGVQYIPSTVAELNTEDKGSTTDFLGATFGVKRSKGKMSTGLGLFYMEGKGQNQMDNEGEFADSSFELLGAMLTSSYQL